MKEAPIMKSPQRLVALLTLAMASAAQAAGRPPPPPPHGGPGGGPGGPGGGYYCPVQQQATLTVRRWYNRNESLPIRQWFNLNENCNGKRLQYVILNGATQQNTWGQAQLVVNNQYVGYAQSLQPGYVQQYNFQPNYYQAVLGSEIGSLQLQLQGVVWVESLTVVFDDYGHGPGGPGGPGYPSQPRTVDLGTVSFVGQTAQTMQLNVGPQVGNVLELDLYAHFDTTIVNGVSIYFTDGRVQNIGRFTIPFQQTQRLSINNGYGARIDRVYINAQRTSPQASGVVINASAVVN